MNGPDMVSSKGGEVRSKKSRRPGFYRVSVAPSFFRRVLRVHSRQGAQQSSQIDKGGVIGPCGVGRGNCLHSFRVRTGLAAFEGIGKYARLSQLPLISCSARPDRRGRVSQLCTVRCPRWLCVGPQGRRSQAEVIFHFPVRSIIRRNRHSVLSRESGMIIGLAIIQSRRWLGY